MTAELDAPPVDLLVNTSGNFQTTQDMHAVLQPYCVCENEEHVLSFIKSGFLTSGFGHVGVGCTSGEL